MGKKLINIDVNSLEIGMILGETIYDSMGNVLLSGGVELKESYIHKLKDFGIPRVKILLGIEPDIISKEKYPDSLEEVRIEAKEIIKETMNSLYYYESANIEKVIKIVSQIIDELIKNKDISLNLNNLRSLDDYTFEHSVNVCILSLLIGINMGFEEDKLREIGIGAFLHDIGKVLIPADILNKPSKLTGDEYEIVKKHTIFGYEMLKKSSLVSELAADIVLSHHERPDGKGYPLSKEQNSIDVFSRIVAISDVFDALTSDRVYKKKIDPFSAVEYMIKMANTQFDKNIVYEFISALGLYPLGSIVRLNTREVGKIIKINKLYPQKPIVRIIMDNNGCKVKEYFEVDIYKNPSVHITDIMPISY